MGPIAVNRLMRRMRRHLAGVMAVFALASVIVLHHAEMPIDQAGAMPSTPGMTMGVGGGHHDNGMAAMTICLGAFVALGAAVAATCIGVIRLGRWHALAAPQPQALLRAELIFALPRAGPPSLPALGVWRI